MARFQPGHSGNPGGRPRGHGDLRELARQHTESALATLVNVMTDPAAPPAARVTAAAHLLDRGFGKPESRTRLELAHPDLGERLRAARVRVIGAEASRVPEAPVARLCASHEAQITPSEGTTETTLTT